MGRPLDKNEVAEANFDPTSLDAEYPQAERFPATFEIKDQQMIVEVLQNPEHQKQVGKRFKHCVGGSFYCDAAQRGEVFLVIKPTQALIDSNPKYADKALCKGLVVHAESDLDVQQIRGFANRLPDQDELKRVHASLDWIEEHYIDHPKPDPVALVGAWVVDQDLDNMQQQQISISFQNFLEANQHLDDETIEVMQLAAISALEHHHFSDGDLNAFEANLNPECLPVPEVTEVLYRKARVP